MGQALDLLRPHLEHAGGASPGVVVLGTVQGDVHEIGKNIVSIVLSADGFDVHDLGEDVSPQDFVNKARELGADVVGMSALISIAVSKMAETVSLLKESDFAGRVIVGGAAITQESADDIGADAFAADAWGALRQVRALARGAEA
jgi:5-methyltetrahydrofolate--homocysteine methyltransferase